MNDKPELIYEFWDGKLLIDRRLSSDQKRAEQYFLDHNPEYEEDFKAGKIKVTSRPPRY